MRTDENTRREVLAVLNGTWKAYAARDPEMVLSFYASEPNVLVLGSGPDEQYVGPKQAGRAGRRPGRGTPRVAHGRAGEAARGVSPAKLSIRSRRRAVSHARAVACLLAVREFGLARPAVVHLLNISPTVVREGLARAEFLAKRRRINFASLVGARREHP
jgi:hypothetical protein